MFLAVVLALSAAAAQRPRIEAIECSRFAPVAQGVSAECGFLRVAEDRDNPHSRTIGVPFAIVHNPHRTEDDPVIFLTGGPGGRAIPRTLRGVDPGFGGRDLVYFEQRGTALADPRLDCDGYAEEKQRAQRGEIGPAELARGLIAVAVRCATAARHSGVSLAGYTTRAIVADIEDFRAARGYPKINLVGLSYSGKVVSEFARDHPRQTRAVVANTPLTLEANYDEQGQSAMRRTLDLIFASCAQNVACRAAHPNLESKLGDVIARAAKDPWRLDVPDTERSGATVSVRATPWVVANALLDQLYSPETFELIPARIDAIWSGDRKALAGIIDVGKSSYPWLMRLALWCNEEVPFEDPQRIAAELDAYPEFARVDQSTIPLGLCKAAGFDAKPAASENMPVRSGVPFLIFAGLFDPAIPPDIERRMAASLPHATLALFPWAGHGAGFSICGGKLVGAFLKDPSARLDVSCTADPPAPDFARNLNSTP